MRHLHDEARRSRRMKALTSLSLVGGLVLLTPSAASAQQNPAPPVPPAPTPTVTDSAICAELMPYMMENMALVMDSVSVMDTIPEAAQKALAAAITKGHFDSASTILRKALPDSSNPKTIKGIGVFFKMLAAVPDTARPAIVEEFTKEAVIPRGTFRLFAEMPDTLQKFFITLFASGKKKKEISCSP